MTSSDEITNHTPAAAPPVATLLRLEGLAVAALAAILYAQTGANWWLFAALWLVPDLSMLGYLTNARAGALCYNTMHTYLLPVTLAAAALLTHKTAPLPYLLLWCNHIGVDRLCGYGLKYSSGFGFTHLSQLGKR